MGRGRPPSGLGHVDRLDGDAATKHRLRVILATLTGAMTVEAACRELEVSEARFHVLRREALEGALAALQPKRPGRPAAPEPTETELKLAAQKEQIDDLELSLEASRIREKLALTMPHVLHVRDDADGAAGPSKKKSRRRRKKKRR